MKLEWEKVPVRGSNRVLQEHEKAELPDRNYIQVYLLAFPHQPYRVQANLTRPDNINLTVNVLSGQGGTTIEGIKATDGTLHPVQAAFVAENAPHCGFCTPGQVMSAVALLRDNPRPTREEAIQAMSGNLCRCGAYEHYLNGVMRAAELLA